MDCLGATKKETIECNEVEEIHKIVKKEVEKCAATKQGPLLKENIPPLGFKSCVREDLHKRMPQHVNAALEATPKKQKKRVEDPPTPTFNMKLLTNLAANREYASYVSPIMTSQESSPMIFPSKEKLKRKEKSLSIICTRFLNMYPLHPSADQYVSVSLDDACFNLGIERRRLYDIVNVFESINMLNKESKNRYRWFGKNKLYQSLQQIKETAEKENVLAKLLYVLELEENKPDKQTCLLDDVADFYKQFESRMSPLTLRLQNEARREKSLAFISQRFLMLFLVSPTKILSLSAAAKVLNGFHKNDSGAQMKTHIRRLYDIANVLSSVGLISKEVIINHYGKKPAFKYIGPDLTAPNISRTESSITTPKKVREKSRTFTRHSSFQDICAVAEMEHKKLFSLDESPKSAPPFERSIHKKDQKTGVNSFSEFSFLSGHDSPKPSTKEITASPSEVSPKTPVQARNETRFFPIQPNLKLVNVPKGVFSKTVPYYLISPVLSNESTRSPKPISALLLFTPESSSKALILSKTPKSAEVGASKSNEALNLPRSSLVSINNQLSTPQAASFNPNTQHVIPKKLEFLSEPDEGGDARSQGKDASEVECCESSSKCSTRNSSPMSSTSRLASPFSIPSGYVTPVPSVSLDAVFPSGVETSSILKGIEADSSDQPKTVRAGEKCSSKGLEDDKENTHSLKTPGVIQLLKSKNISLPLKDTSNFSMWNSCSNDSVNSEVSEILNGKRLGEHVWGKKNLELDENTILSPIKKTKIATPSKLPYIPQQMFVLNSNSSYVCGKKRLELDENTISSPIKKTKIATPSKLPYVPEQMFVFNSNSYQSLSKANKVLYHGPLKISLPANKNNTSTS